MRAISNQVVLEHLKLNSFRLYESLDFRPQPGLNVIHGGNGTGKTALLEAAYLLSAARSFRAKKESELVLWGSTFARVEGFFRTGSGRPRTLSILWTRQDGDWTKSATLQGDKVARLADFLGCVPSSLFTPNDLDLVAGPPASRRRYLDLQLSKMMPAHLSDLSQLRKVLSSRNALLRQRRPTRELVPWERLLHELAVRVGQRREELVKELDSSCREFHHRLAGESGGAISLRYRRAWPVDPHEFHQKISELRERERQLGTTLLSPQKDELEVHNEGRSLRTYGSQGQQRSLALCLRLAEARTLSAHQQEGALLLLDDVLSELDETRRFRLFELLPEFPQVLLTCTHELSKLAPQATHHPMG